MISITTKIMLSITHFHYENLELMIQSFFPMRMGVLSRVWVTPSNIVSRLYLKKKKRKKDNRETIPETRVAKHLSYF